MAAADDLNLACILYEKRAQSQMETMTLPSASFMADFPNIIHFPK